MSHLTKTSMQITLAFMITAAVADSACGQSDRRRRDDAPTARALENRVEKAEESLVGEYKEVATEFYKQGDREKAMTLLQRLSSLNPTMPGLKEQIKQIQDELLEENPGEVTFDTRNQVWLAVGRVQKGKTVRMQCTGDYKLTLTSKMSVEGLQKTPSTSGEQPPRRRGAGGNGKGQQPKRTQEEVNFVENLPLGCLAGIIVEGKDLGEPFQISGSTTLNPKSDGILFIKTNLPAGCRCTGKLELVFSGYIDTESKQ
ncbi:MAG: hypothetical protein ABJZ55_25630 [Fuerstiella sp.]